jgi:hypothetical protein
METNTKNTNERKVNEWFEKRYKRISRFNNVKCRNAIIDKCNEVGIECTIHKFYNWLGHQTPIKGYIAKIVKEELSRWEEIDKAELNN